MELCLLAWIGLYSRSNPNTQLGPFFGNAVADWTGLLVSVLAPKFLYEVGSVESRKPPHYWFNPIREFLQDHSLTIFLIVTGLGWVGFSAPRIRTRSGDKLSGISSRSAPRFSESFG